MVKRLALLAILGITAMANASESGTYSSRAQRYLNAGKFAKGYSLLEKALLASRKEADLLSEGRVLVGMAQIRTMSLDLDFADSLLTVVRNEVLDKNTTTNLTKVKVALANAREKYGDGVKICNAADQDSIKKSEEQSRGAFYAECAISYAGARNSDKSQEFLKLAGKATDKKSGYYAFTAAQIADINGDSSADSLYQVAEAKSIQGNKPYMTATILYKRSQLGVNRKEAEDMKLRCRNAFELMGLPNNAKRCAE